MTPLECEIIVGSIPAGAISRKGGSIWGMSDKVNVCLRVRRAVMVDGKSIREASRVFGLHRDTVRKMLVFSVPPGYLGQSPPKRPKQEPFTGVIDRILTRIACPCPSVSLGVVYLPRTTP